MAKKHASKFGNDFSFRASVANPVERGIECRLVGPEPSKCGHRRTEGSFRNTVRIDVGRRTLNWAHAPAKCHSDYTAFSGRAQRVTAAFQILLTQRCCGVAADPITEDRSADPEIHGAFNRSASIRSSVG
jgi:hypothetical protein